MCDPNNLKIEISTKKSYDLKQIQKDQIQYLIQDLKQQILTSNKDLKILMHCFTGSKEFAKKMMTLNAYFSASGIITFKNSNDLQETFKMIENDKILIETDSPFLAPIPMRGKKNEPSFIKYTLEKLSELKSKTFDELETITNDNFERLFFQ